VEKEGKESQGLQRAVLIQVMFNYNCFQHW